MNERHKVILHTFLPDRIHHNRRVAERTGIPIYDVANATWYLSQHGYLDKVIVASKKGKPNKNGRPITNYFRLTQAGRRVAEEYDLVRESRRIKVTALIESGMSAAEAAMALAVDSTESDNSTC